MLCLFSDSCEQKTFTFVRLVTFFYFGLFGSYFDYIPEKLVLRDHFAFFGRSISLNHISKLDFGDESSSLLNAMVLAVGG